MKPSATRRIFFVLLVLVGLWTPANAAAKTKTKTKTKKKTAPSISWKKVGVVNTGGGLTALDCPSGKFCIAAGGQSVLTTSTPTGGLSGWASDNVDQTVNFDDETNVVTAAACATGSDCAIGDSSNNGWFSGAPLQTAWQPFTFPSDVFLDVEAIGCSPLGNCTALNVDHHAMSTSSLNANPSWSFVQLPGTDTNVSSTQTGSVSCPSYTCVLSDESQYLYRTTNAGASWTALKPVGAADLISVDCPRATFCIAGALDAPLRHVWVSTNPGRASSWKSVSRFAVASDWVKAVACTNARQPRCFVAMDNGRIYSTLTPTVPKSWKLNTGAHLGVDELSCPTTHLCVAASQSGAIAYAKF